MAQFLPSTMQFPIEEQIKTLGDDELLDFWEETQYLERFLEEESSGPAEASSGYERLIVQELQLRSCRRCACKI